MLAIHELESRKKRLTKKAIEEFLEARRFPLVEGPSVTFVYHGAADNVLLQHFIYGLPTSRPFKRIAGSDLWYLVLEVPPESRFEYKFDIVHGSAHQWIRDPLNPLTARDPFGANSVATTGSYERPDWSFFDPEARPGSYEDHHLRSKVLGRRQGVKVYLPARFRHTRRYPLLVVHDGEDYLNYASLGTVLDNLIHRMEVAPMVVALISSPRRLAEYAADPAHGRFVVEELLPFLEKEYPLDARPEARGLMGASFGGVASLSTAWRHPGVFGRLLLQSGSFAFTDIGHHKRGPAFDPVVAWVNEFRDRPGRPAQKVFVSCGTYESLIYENRSLVPLLQATGMEVRYAEARDGHNWENWRDRLRQALTWLFPGPLWMIYE
ncbi:MAG TPA: alpha/beta hydrolase-fold protein [Thermoanaerobaculia bacterium]|nr:alpha/beta hydrolase-fold protein [Thermoanaerobaculia bacterium]